MKNNSCIIIFCKYPEAEKVKTRLGREIGHKKAVNIYKIFLKNLGKILNKIDKDKIIFMNSLSNEKYFTNLFGNNNKYYLQTGNNLGEKMFLAFKKVFSLGYKNAVIIGSDVPEITDTIINKGINLLDKKHFVIGPTIDGGYYLLGINKNNLDKIIFEDIDWSTDKVFKQTCNKIKILNKSKILLKKLNDIDTLSDLKNYINRTNNTNLIC